jgi:hypothetical protein
VFLLLDSACSGACARTGGDPLSGYRETLRNELRQPLADVFSIAGATPSATGVKQQLAIAGQSVRQPRQQPRALAV